MIRQDLPAGGLAGWRAERFGRLKVLLFTILLFVSMDVACLARFEAFGGEQGDAKLDSTLSRSLDLRNHNEAHVIARAKNETGIGYGATIESEADTNSTSNTDESAVRLAPAKAMRPVPAPRPCSAPPALDLEGRAAEPARPAFGLRLPHALRRGAAA